MSVLQYNPTAINAAALQTRRPMSQARHSELLSKALMEAKEKDPLYNMALDRTQYQPPEESGVTGEIAKHLMRWSGEQEVKGIDEAYQGKQSRRNEEMTRILTGGGDDADKFMEGLPPQQRQIISRVLQSGDPDMIEAIVGQVVKQSFDPGKAKKYETVNANGKVYRVNDADTSDITEIGEQDQDLDQVEMVGPEGPGVYNRNKRTGQIVGSKIGGIYNKPPSTVVNNIDNGEKSFQKEFGKTMATNFDTMVTQAQAAPQTIAKINEFRNLTRSGIQTGKVQDMTLPARQFFNSIGITDDQNIAGQETINSIASNFVLDKFNSLKGPQTDKDAILVAGAVPQLSKTPEGNALILDLAERAEQYKIEMANEASGYVSLKGQLDPGWIQHYSQWAQKNPLLTPELRAQVQAAKSGKTVAPRKPFTYVGPEK